ncbi:MAG: transposase [Chloroflexi bacterium]|nr:transposase [Chloroflexota bacterium]
MADEHGTYPRRHSIRLQNYDYAQAGAYFVTICVQDRRLLLASAPVHNMLERWWSELPHRFATIELDAFVVMPNHVHGIVVMTEAAGTDEVSQIVALPAILQWFKTMTTNEYIRGVKQRGWTSFEGHLWQRSYWDHVIRDAGDLARLRAYIASNPAHWNEDALRQARSGGYIGTVADATYREMRDLTGDACRARSGRHTGRPLRIYQGDARTRVGRTGEGRPSEEDAPTELAIQHTGRHVYARGMRVHTPGCTGVGEVAQNADAHLSRAQRRRNVGTSRQLTRPIRLAMIVVQ